MISPLEAILKDLKQTALISALLASSVRYLHISSTNCIAIPIQNGLTVQLELDKDMRRLLVGCAIGSLQPNPYRHKIFLEALKINGLTPPHCGVFAFSKATNHLILFQYLDLRDLNGEKVAEFLAPFIEKAKIWQEALQRGDLPSVKPPNAPADKGIFGLKL